MSSTGFYQDGVSPNPWASFPLNVGSDAFVSFRKLPNGVDTSLNTIGAQAVRSKVFQSVALSNTASTTIAHGLVDEDGKAVTPIAIDQLAGPGALFSTQAPDATNLYLQATAAGNYTFRVRY